MHENTTSTKNPSVLADLRSLVPPHDIGFQHALRVAERQADELLRRSGHIYGPTPDDIVTRFPRIKVIYRDGLPTSGVSRWNGSQWVIFLRADDCHARQRFTMMHELAHVIHHGSLGRHFDGRRFLADEPNATEAKRQRERAADHFAGCLLMPRDRVLALWANGVRRAEDFASHFDVSPAAAQVRLEQVGLVQPRWMCTRGLRTTPASFSAATTTKMRALGLRAGGRPSMRKRSRPHTITAPTYAHRRFA